MSRTYEPPKCTYTVVGNHIETDRSVMKKVSGSRIAGIRGISHFNTPFQVACDLLGLARDADIGSKPAVIAGRVLETVVIDYISRAHPEIGLLVPASEVYPASEGGDHDQRESNFEDDTFSGLVDGIVMGDDGEDYILEVKTSSNMEDWKDGVPEYYYWQVALYNHFITKQDRAYVLLGIMDPAALKDPRSWVPSEENCTYFPVDIDREAAAEGIREAAAWYDEYVRNGRTPDYDPSVPGDVEMFMHLASLTDDEDAVRELVDRNAEIRAEIKVHEAGIRALYEAREQLDTRLKDYLSCHRIDNLASTSGKFRAVVSTSVRKGFDEELMIADGLDPEKYRTTRTTTTFTIKPVTDNQE